MVQRENDTFIDEVRNKDGIQEMKKRKRMQWPIPTCLTDLIEEVMKRNCKKLVAVKDFVK